VRDHDHRVRRLAGVDDLVDRELVRTLFPILDPVSDEMAFFRGDLDAGMKVGEHVAARFTYFKPRVVL